MAGKLGCSGLGVAGTEVIPEVLRFEEFFTERVSLAPSDVIPQNNESFSQGVSIIVT